jgi:hypothetical protein
VRLVVVSAWVKGCTFGLNKIAATPPPSCGGILCAATRIGALVQGLQTAGLFPSRGRAEFMHRSITAYWKGINSIGAEYKPYESYTGIGYRGSHQLSCTFEACFGDFGIIEDAKATLQRHVHKDIWKQWLAASVPVHRSFKPMLTKCRTGPFDMEFNSLRLSIRTCLGLSKGGLQVSGKFMQRSCINRR